MTDQAIYIARILMEAETPLFIGSGKSSLLKDALVQRDANGFPMIPGTALAGVLRQSLGEKYGDLANRLFGSAKKRKKGQKSDSDPWEDEQRQGSGVKVSPGMLRLSDRIVSEGLFTDGRFDSVRAQFENLTVRQRVALDDKGTAKKGHLYDHEVIYQGVQFVFELEAPSSLVDEKDWKLLLDGVKSAHFRLGAGTRNGFGLLKAKQVYSKTLTIQDYLNHAPAFNDSHWWEELKPVGELKSSDQIVSYRLELTPDPFFIFGSGLSDEDVDQTPVTEYIADYSSGTLKLSDQPYTLIPGSSVKGALAHRVAYHYNKKVGRYASKESIKDLREKENEAVTALFGNAGENASEISAGKVFFKDVLIEPAKVSNEEIFNHVAIDRFTGGAMDGMLFSEKVSHFRESAEQLTLEVQLQLTKDTAKYQTYLEEALKDICRGLLPLGGMTTKGHGIFTGKLMKDENEELFNYPD